MCGLLTRLIQSSKRSHKVQRILGHVTVCEQIGTGLVKVCIVVVRIMITVEDRLLLKEDEHSLFPLHHGFASFVSRARVLF